MSQHQTNRVQPRNTPPTDTLEAGATHREDGREMGLIFVPDQSIADSGLPNRQKIQILQQLRQLQPVPLMRFVRSSPDLPLAEK